MDAHPTTLSAKDFQAHAQWVLRLAGRLLRDAGEAEDVAQETWLAALRNPPQGELRPWLGQVCHNFARQHLRSRFRRMDRERLAASDERGLDPVDLVERAEIGKVLVELVLGLGEPYRSTMLLRYQEGLSTERIAEVQGVSAGTVRGRLSRAAEKLRAELDERHGGDRQCWCAGLAALVAQHGEVEIGVGTASGLIKGVLTMVALHKLVATATTVLVVVWGVSYWGFPEPVTPPDTRALDATGPTRTEGVARGSETRLPENGPAVAAATDREPVRVLLASTRGRVVALASQVGIEGVEVNLVREGEPTKAIATDRTGPDGIFSFAERPISAGLVVAEPPEGWRVVPSRSSLGLAGPDEEHIILVLRRARSARVHGRLLDEADGLPLGDFALRLLLGETWEDFTTDAEGYFRSRRDYEEGEYLLGLVDSGFIFADSAWIDHLPWGEPAGRAQEFHVRVGPTFLLDLALPEGLRATDFQATLRRGREPAAEEEIVASYRFRPVRDGEPPWVRFSNDSAEKVTSAGPWHLAVGSLDGLWSGWAPVPQVRGILRDPLRVEFSGCGRLAGRVVDEEGRPRPSISLELLRQVPNTTTKQGYEALSESDGGYSIPYVKPGDYWLQVSHWSNVEAAPMLVRVEAGVSLDPFDVHVRDRRGEGSVAGWVRSATGTYHGRTRIRIFAGGPYETEVEWEEADDAWIGRFEIPEVPEGEHRVMVTTSPRFLLRTISRENVRAPCGDLQIFVRDELPTFDLQFRVLDAGTDSELSRFYFEIDFAERFMGGTGGDERAEPALRDLPEGREFEWSVRANGYAPAYGTQSDIPELGDVRIIEVRLEPGWGARFHLFDEDTGDPLAGVRVLFDDQEVGVTGPDGNLEVALPARPEKLEVSSDDWALSSGWSVDPETGRFDDESWLLIYVPLRRGSFDR